MVKKVFLISILVLGWSLFSSDYPGIRWGLSLGFFFNHQEANSSDSNLDSQVDSLTLFMVNMKFGGLFRVGYHFNPYLATGLESGVLFNTYQQQGPFRAYLRLGPPNLNVKAIGGISVNRIVPLEGNGVDGAIVAGTIEGGFRVEIINIYIEWLESNSINDLIDSSTKISFGYSLFLPI